MLLVPGACQGSYTQLSSSTCADQSSTYSFTLTYTHEVNNRQTTFEVLSKPSWLTLDSFDFQNKIGVFSGIPQTSDIATNFTLSIKLIDEKQKAKFDKLLQLKKNLLMLSKQ